MFDSLVTYGFTQAINFTAGGAGDTTVRSVVAGKKFVVTHAYIESSAAIDLIVKSGATALSGTIAIAANGSVEFKNGGAPIWKGSATGDDLVFNVSGAADIDGFAYMQEVDR